MKTTPDPPSLPPPGGPAVDADRHPRPGGGPGRHGAQHERMADFARKHQVRWRPHAKMHKSAGWPWLQMQAGTVGVCVQKTAEAEAMVAGGVLDITSATK
jgi:3-hydroxy-D-aspartate aldolase